MLAMFRLVMISCLLVSLGAWPPNLATGQDEGVATTADAEPDEVPVIADEPKTVDPANLMPAELARNATQDFSDSSLREVVDWLQTEQGLVVLVDERALAEIGVSPAEPISDRLDDAPLYMLLDRLQTIGIRWYFDEEILYLTSEEKSETRAQMETYNVGDLLDADYKLSRLKKVIVETIAADSWTGVGGEGDLNALGDVLFVRQSDSLQRKVNGLLTALRGHGRRTFINDPNRHMELREKLNQNVSVEFFDTPLVTAIEQLAEIADADIRLDMMELRENRIREREPVTLTLADRKLKTVLQAMVVELNLTWILRDGVLLITSPGEAELYPKTAVYDVRDLCPDEDLTQSLIEAITAQTEPDSWSDVGGIGTIEYAKAGTLVMSHQEYMHTEVLNLLETYRSALQNFKPRDRVEDGPDEVIVVYYRLHSNVARDLSSLLPALVQPETWRSGAQPDAVGEIFLSSSSPELSLDEMGLELDAESSQDGAALVISRSVLIVRHTRATHKEIEKIIGRVESGDGRSSLGGGMGGGLGGGGVF